MAANKPTYDLTLLLDPSVEEDDRSQIVTNVEELIAQSGELVERSDWGLRPTTFRIEHKSDADYRLLQFKGPSELLDQLNHNLKIVDGVMRFRIIKSTPGAPSSPDLKRQPVEESPKEVTTP